MSATDRRRGPGLDSEAVLIWSAIALVVGSIGLTHLALHVGHALRGTEPSTLTGNPLRLVMELLTGRIGWPWQSTLVLVATLLVLATLITLVFWLRRRHGSRGSRVDPAARHMGRGRDLAPLSARAAKATAQRFGMTDSTGLLIGRTLVGNQPLYATWEDMHLNISGPRTGKITAFAIPAILEAPGAVLVTSNKRDVLDATRDVRAAGSGPVWVFDPQGIAGEEPTWWWDPLSYVTDDVRAARLAQHFASGSRDPGARTDAYFDPAGQDLLAGMLLAAALDGRAIRDVYAWLTRPTDPTPVDVLRQRGYDLIAEQVEGVQSAPEKQRGGVYGTAQQMASCLTNSTVARWVNPTGPSDPRRQLDPAKLLEEHGTLYSLSREGRGTAGPLVTALTVAVIEQAEERAARSPGGRLPVPLLGVLDEAANVCRWGDLPDLYSHFGSRGIVLMTILQSWSQGVDVWGEHGMKKLWSAANIKVYGGGVAERAFLEDLSAAIGDHDRERASVTTGRGNSRSVSSQTQRERILDVADLAALPRSRALVIASGARPTLIRTHPWMESRHAGAIRASIAAHDPSATTRSDRPELDDVR